MTPSTEDPAPRPGILITNLGSPDRPTPRAVRRYLAEFLADPMVVDAPRAQWWLIRNLIILPFRSPRSARLYRSIWTPDGSPLLAISRRQAAALKREIEDRLGHRIPLALGMRYGRPSLKDGFDELVGDGCTEILVLPLYPQYSRTTVGTTVAALKAVANASLSAPSMRCIEGYATHQPYVSALAAAVREIISSDRPNHLIMSFHGLPQRYADAGDPYPEQCEATAQRLASELELRPDAWSLCYQSRFGREQWLEPAADRVLHRLGSRGTNNVAVVCPGFSADCLETLEEVAVGLRRLYNQSGGRGFAYVPALNDRPDHIRALADILWPWLRPQEGSDRGCR